MQLLLKRYDGFHRPVRTAFIFILLSGLTFVFWLFQTKTFFLGDGYLCLRNLPSASALGEAAFAFKRTPFAGVIIFQVYRLFDFFGAATPSESAYRWVSIFAGMGTAAAAWIFVRLFSEDRLEKVLLLLLLLSSGASQLFFGYVENYALVYPCIFFFLFFGIAYIRENIHLVWPVILFGVVLILHFGGLAFIPALIWLIILAWRRNQCAELAASLFLTCAVVFAMLYFCGYSPRLLQLVFLGGRSYTLPFIGTLEKNQAYHLFSWNHFVDILNFLFLVVPGSLTILILSAVIFWKKAELITPEIRFVLLSAVCGLGFLFFVNCELGMSRDWDLLAPLQVGIFAAAAAMWISAAEDTMIRLRVLVTIGLAALLHMAPFIGVNASQERSMARFHMLQESNLWSTHAKLDAFEVMAIYHRERKDFSQSIQWYLRYVALDSSNRRLWWNLATAHAEAGNTREAFNVYKTMIRLGMEDANVWTGMGALIARSANRAQQDRFSEALTMFRRAEQLDPASPLIQCDIGAMIVETEQDYSNALPYFLEAIRLDSTFAGAYENAAICYTALGDSNSAQQYRMLSKKYEQPYQKRTVP